MTTTNMENFLNRILELGYEGILFDMDGTLLDSMMMWHEIDVRFMAEKGLDMPEDLQLQIGGMSMYETAVYFRDTFHMPDTIDDLMSRWTEMAIEFYENEVEFKPGALDFLTLLMERKIPIALGTSNGRKLVEASLRHHPILSKIKGIITSDEIKNGKPAPDVYITAAKSVGVSPEKCIVFDDLIQGIRAGNSAGATVIAIDDKNSRKILDEKIAESRAMIKDFTELDGELL